MNRFVGSIVLILLSSFVSTPALAVLISVDPDDYAPGTNLSSIVPGVSLSVMRNPTEGEGGGPVLASVYAAFDPTCAEAPDDCQAVTGSNVFSRSSDPVYVRSGLTAWFDSPAAARCLQTYPANSCYGDNFATLLIGFANPTDYVEISGAYRRDAPIIYLYDASRTLIGQAGSIGDPLEPSDGNFQIATPFFQSSTANISYVIAAGWSAASSLDALRYNDVSQSVPEPGTGLLLAVGLLLIVLMRRRAASKPGSRSRRVSSSARR